MDDKKDIDQNSDTGSELSVDPENEQNPAKTFEVLKKPLQRHYAIESTSNGQYYVDISTFTPKKPDLTMHAGANDKGAIVAVSHFVKLSTRFQIGCGDPTADPSRLPWEEMARENRRGSAYSWSMELDHVRRNFLWKRTRSVGVDGKSPSTIGLRNWKLVDADSNAVLAVFSATRSTSKCGDLQIRTSLGDAFDGMVLITFLSLYEKGRRRNASAGSAGGGGA